LVACEPNQPPKLSFLVTHEKSHALANARVAA